MLAIDQSPSEFDAHNRLSGFVTDSHDTNPTSLPIGDKAYLWNGSHIVFLKGRFTFWLDGTVDLRVGDLLVNRDFIEKLARDIATAVNAGGLTTTCVRIGSFAQVWVKIGCDVL